MKKLDKDNWLNPDPTLSYFAKVSEDGQKQSISGEDWLREIYSPQLSDNVPHRGQGWVGRG